MNTPLDIVCRYTGIRGTVDMPSVPRKALEYTHPLANIDSVNQVFDEGRGYVKRLDNTILAGMCITVMRHYKAFIPSAHGTHPAAINKLLSSCKRSTLLKLVDVLREYVIPALSVGKAKNFASVTLETIPAEGTDLWVKGITTALLHDVCGISTNEGDAFNSIDPDQAGDSVKAELRHKLYVETMKKVEQRRAAREATKREAQKKKTVFTLSDLDETETGTSVVEEFMRENSQSVHEIPVNALYTSLVKDLQKSHVINRAQAATLNNLGTALFTMEEARRNEVVSKLQLKDSKYYKGLATLIKICGNFAQKADEVLGLLEAVEEKNKPSLRERLAKAKRGK